MWLLYLIVPFFGTFWTAAYQFGQSMVRITHGEIKLVWYAAEAYHKGTIRYYRTQIRPSEHDIV